MKLRLATAVLLLLQLAPAQETAPSGSVADRFAKLARGSPQDRLAAILYLEDSRSTDEKLWRIVLGANEDGERRLDRKYMARAIHALGRVGEPELRVRFKWMVDESGTDWTPEYRRAMGLAAGLFADPEHLGDLSAWGVPANFFAMGLMKKAPKEGPPPVPAEEPAAESRPRTGAETFTDPVEAALRWGAVIDPPVFAELAVSVLKEHKTPIRLRAAVDYFARSKAKAPAAVRPLLTEQLKAEDPELAGLAARALAKSEGAGDSEVSAIEAAFAAGTDRIAQVDRVRALGTMKSAAAAEALVRSIGLSKSDAAVRRTVMEALKGVAWDGVKPEIRKSAGTLVKAIVVPREGESPARADVRAAAVLALAAIDPARFQAALPELRLAAPWPMRAAAATAVVALAVGYPDLDPIRRFLADPDRRVRIATLEALGEKTVKLSAEARKAVMMQALGRERLVAGKESEWTLATRDPVEISVAAALVNGLEEPNADWFLQEATEIPMHEVEALQAVIDLAGRTQANDVLKRYAMSSESSLRKRARELLAKNGVEVKEPMEPGTGSNLLLDRCVERAKKLFENPAPSVVVETTRGSITIQLYAVDAPATVENFLQLAKWGFYDGILWHRVVPAFVAQAGCPRGDGWGGPGYTIRCEVNDRTYRRGSVGMALAGKDTGGSQFFICHRALPHLDGRYTLFGQVVDGMDVVDNLTQDDVILKVREI